MLDTTLHPTLSPTHRVPHFRRPRAHPEPWAATLAQEEGVLPAAPLDAFGAALIVLMDCGDNLAAILAALDGDEGEAAAAAHLDLEAACREWQEASANVLQAAGAVVR